MYEAKRKLWFSGQARVQINSSLQAQKTDYLVQHLRIELRWKRDHQYPEFRRGNVFNIFNEQLSIHISFLNLGISADTFKFLTHLQLCWSNPLHSLKLIIVESDLSNWSFDFRMSSESRPVQHRKSSSMDTPSTDAPDPSRSMSARSFLDDQKAAPYPSSTPFLNVSDIAKSSQSKVHPVL